MRTLLLWVGRIRWSGLLLLVNAIIPVPTHGQNQELTFSLGGIPGQTHGISKALPVPHKFPRIAALELTMAIVCWMSEDRGPLWQEIEFVALPNRNVTAATATVPQSYASLYLAPGLHV